MTLEEAYEIAKDKVQELKDSGITVIVAESKSRGNEKMTSKYSGPDHLPTSEWYHVTFINLDDEQAQQIFEVANYLGMCGIKFDTGGMVKMRDWEFDWSFKLIEDEDDLNDWIEGREKIEELIESMGNGVMPNMEGLEDEGFYMVKKEPKKYNMEDFISLIQEYWDETHGEGHTNANMIKWLRNHDIEE